MTNSTLPKSELESPIVKRVRRAPMAKPDIQKWVKEHLRGGTQDLDQARIVLRERCKQDLWFLCFHVLDMPDVDNQLHHGMCERWESRRDRKFTLWMTPRFHLKTSLWTRGGTIQELLIDPDQRILIINAKLEIAEEILADIKLDWETNDLLRWLFPEYVRDWADKGARNRAKWLTSRLDFPNSRFAGRKEGNIQVMGVEASLVSKHYDLMVYDDPVNDLNSATKAYRDKIQRWYQNSLNLRVDTKSRIRLIGTRWHFDDLYSRIIKQEMDRRKRMRELGRRIKPRYLVYHRAVVEKVLAGGERLAGFDGVQPIWPERFSGADITQMREDLASYVFACQMMNNPVPEEDAIFRFTDIHQIDLYDIPAAEEVVNFMAVDMAVEESEHGDFTVITVASFDSFGKMYVRKILRDKFLPSKMLQHVADLVRVYDVKRVAIETVAFQKTLLRVYKEIAARENYYIPWVEMKRGKSSKLKRILSMQPRVERGDFLVEEGIENTDWLIEEMTTYPRSAHDDILDTLADLEALFYKAPEPVEDNEPVDTYDAYYGKLEDLVDEDDESGSVVDSEWDFSDSEEVYV